MKNKSKMISIPIPSATKPNPTLNMRRSDLLELLGLPSDTDNQVEIGYKSGYNQAVANMNLRINEAITSVTEAMVELDYADTEEFENISAEQIKEYKKGFQIRLMELRRLRAMIKSLMIGKE